MGVFPWPTDKQHIVQLYLMGKFTADSILQGLSVAKAEVFAEFQKIITPLNGVDRTGEFGLKLSPNQKQIGEELQFPQSQGGNILKKCLPL